MKKIILTALFVAFIVPSAFAFSLGGYVGPVEIKFYDYTIGRAYTLTGGQWIPEGPRAGLPGGAQPLTNGTYYPVGADSVEDSWGVLGVAGIYPGGSLVPLWVPSVNEELTAYYYGFNDAYIASTATGIDLGNVGGMLDLYLDTTTNFTAAPSPYANARPAGGIDAWGVTDGTLFLSTTVTPGVVPAMPNLTRYETVQGLSFPYTGSGSMYLTVTGGSHAGLFDSNGYLGGNADLYSIFNFGPVGAYVWDSKSSDPTYGDIVPEPASMVLFGIGMLGLATLRRKKVA